MKSWLLIGSVILAAVVVVGCDSEPPQPQTSQNQSAKPDALPADLFATTAPDGAVDVVAAKSMAEGQAVVIKGVVAGQLEPLAANRAIMTVADASLQTCNKTPGDTCATPWDACCEPKDVIAAKTISVQVIGADGQPLKAGLKDAGNLAPNKQVVVSGTTRKVADALVVQAKHIHVVN
jgi:hypothetical protein